MNERIMKELFEKLEEKYAPLWPWPEGEEFDRDPFKRLIITVLSQNTNDLNTARAYEGLSNKFEVNPFTLSNAPINEIKDAIKHGGLYNIKANRIKEISKKIIERFNGDLTRLMKLPKEKIREEIMALPGIGPKTADVLLTTRYGHKVIPIDTHYNRISKRLGLVDNGADYDEIQSALTDFIPIEFRERCSGLLWLLAKHTCKARAPECENCLLSNLCEYAKGGKHVV
jgi:endonuclease-3